jgi:hypothetical protein
MSITLFGSCRIRNIAESNTINKEITYTHCTKEVLQCIKFIRGELDIPEKYRLYCFRKSILDNAPISFDEKYNKMLNLSKLCIIEICSAKQYIHNNFYLHHISVDKRFKHHNISLSEDILNNYRIKKQSDSEIENDILEIKKLLYPTKLIIVSHYNSKLNGEFIESRNHLIQLLDRICRRHSIIFINPTSVLSHLSQEDVLEKDLGHYTKLGDSEFAKFMNEYINKLKLLA